MSWMHKIIYLLLAYLLPLSIAQAVEFDAQVERVLWRYQEQANGIAGFNQLPSKANGSGALLKLRLSSERDQDWFFAVSAALMDSSSSAAEAWNNGQVNDLSMQQQDVRLDVQYRMLGARFGVWLAQREQRQTREKFVLNGVAIAVAGEPIDEVVTSQWAGLSLTSVGGNMGQFETRIDAALALDMQVTNPLFAAPYSKKDGYRTGIHFRWTLPRSEVGVSGLNITLRYEYQEIGGENTVNNGFWPYNRWQMASMGLMYAW
ncbi:MAG: hypothetical protein Q9M46_02555 [Ghiorsea sp.]|nr:hypothetical protein [Ghiorsea sp.]